MSDRKPSASGKFHSWIVLVNLELGWAFGEHSMRYCCSSSQVAHDPHFAWQQSSGSNVRFGSKADIQHSLTDVRFTPKSGHWLSKSRCPLCAKSRHWHGYSTCALRHWPKSPRIDEDYVPGPQGYRNAKNYRAVVDRSGIRSVKLAPVEL